jgi:hypothetical protein
VSASFQKAGAKKCRCGFEATEPWVLCQILDRGGKKYRVEIYTPDGPRIADSAAELSLEKTLDFIVEVAQENAALPHLHFHKIFPTHGERPDDRRAQLRRRR